MMWQMLICQTDPFLEQRQHCVRGHAAAEDFSCFFFLNGRTQEAVAYMTCAFTGIRAATFLILEREKAYLFRTRIHQFCFFILFILFFLNKR